MGLAWTKNHEASFGNMRAMWGKLDITTIVSGAVATGLEYIEAVQISPGSITTTTVNYHVHRNEGSGGTAINGMVRVQGCVAGDEFHAFFLGR